MSQDRKKLYMWISVAVALLIIGGVWIALLKYNLSVVLLDITNNKNEGYEAIDEFKEIFSQQAKELDNFLEQEISTSTLQVPESGGEASTNTTSIQE